MRFRAGKGSLYEGGLKVPFLVRWPGKISAGSVSDHLLYFPDVMPTLAEASGADCPKTDGLSFMPTLLSDPSNQEAHDYLYWEFGNQMALRQGGWKAYRNKKAAWELYNLDEDIEEQHNVASEHAEVLKSLVKIAEDAHEPVRPGEVFSRELIVKDRRQSPHNLRKEK